MLTTIAKFITRLLLIVAATILMAMMLLTAADVVLRYIFNRPISGGFELVEYMMAVLIPFSIVYCADQRSHVAVDLILGRFSQRVQTVFDSMTTFITLLFAVLIAWENVIYFRETYASQVTSAVLLIPTYPFVAPVSIGIGTFALIMLLDLKGYIAKARKP